MSHQNEITNSSYTGDFSNYHRPPIDTIDTNNTYMQEILDQSIQKQKKIPMIQNVPDIDKRTQKFLKHLEQLTKGGRKKSLRKTNRKRKTRRRRTNRRR